MRTLQKYTSLRMPLGFRQISQLIKVGDTTENKAKTKKELRILFFIDEADIKWLV